MLFNAVLSTLFLILICTELAFSFIVGGCIGPKSVLERLLSPADRVELRRMVHTTFTGDNSQELLSRVNHFVLQKVGPQKWNQILPELVVSIAQLQEFVQAYQSKGHECSIYAQLLPKPVYKTLLNSVWRASESGASKDDLKRLVEDYVDRALAAGVIPSAALQPKTSRSAAPAFYQTAVAPPPVQNPVFPIFQPSVAFSP